jgi:hypothetical protein
MGGARRGAWVSGPGAAVVVLLVSCGVATTMVEPLRARDLRGAGGFFCCLAGCFLVGCWGC